MDKKLILILALIFFTACSNLVPSESVNSGEIEFTDGNGASYITFSRQKFEEARNQNKVVLLEFWAEWCPSCRAQEPKIVNAFNSMIDGKYKDVIGFRVNYDFEQDLKKEFNVIAQHTHVIIDKNGEISKSRSMWVEEQIVEVINSALGEI